MQAIAKRSRPRAARPGKRTHQPSRRHSRLARAVFSFGVVLTLAPFALMVITLRRLSGSSSHRARQTPDPRGFARAELAHHPRSERVFLEFALFGLGLVLTVAWLCGLALLVIRLVLGP
jgi:hypothetical protein